MPIIIACSKNNIPFEYECISYNKMLKDIDKLKLHVDKILNIKIENMDMPTSEEIAQVIEVVDNLPDLKTFTYDDPFSVPSEFIKLSTDVEDRAEKMVEESPKQNAKRDQNKFALTLLYRLWEKKSSKPVFGVNKKIVSEQEYPIAIAAISEGLLERFNPKKEGEKNDLPSKLPRGSSVFNILYQCSSMSQLEKIEENAKSSGSSQSEEIYGYANVRFSRVLSSFDKPDERSSSPQEKIVEDAGVRQTSPIAGTAVQL